MYGINKSRNNTQLSFLKLQKTNKLNNKNKKNINLTTLRNKNKDKNNKTVIDKAYSYHF